MISNQRTKFSLLRTSTYLNCAYMSPLLKAVEKAGIRGMQRKRNPFHVSPTDFFTETELLRKEYAKLIGASQPNRVVVIPSVSYGISTVANNVKLKAGENIVVASEQFPSNYYPWERLCKESNGLLRVVSAPAVLENRGKLWNEAILKAIDDNTRVVALGNVHWADGTLFDLQKVRKKTLDVGSLLVIDGTQSVGALPIDVSRLKPDVLICAGYKWLLGPYSIGLAYYGEALDSGIPLEENWINRKESENFAQLVNYQENYQPGALRFEVGEHSNFILVPMLLESLRQINKWGPQNIQDYCDKITRKPISRLRDAGFWIEDEAFRGKHLFGIRLPSNKNIEDVKMKIQKAKISVSFRGNAIRVAPHLYNTESDMLKLVSALL